MNYSSKKTLLSFLPTGGLLSSKSRIPLKRSNPLKLIHRQVLTAQQPPIKSPETLVTFGQPTHFTHPHRIKKGEVVPGITVGELKLRRDRLLENIRSYCFNRNLGTKNFLIIIPSSCKKYMSEEIPYVFRQNSNFLYLTGCLEQDSLLVITAQSSKDESIIFVRGKNPQSELWDGPRTGVEQAAELFGVDKSMPMTEFSTFVESFMKDNKDCMVWYDFLKEIHPIVHKIMQQYLTGTWNKVGTSNCEIAMKCMIEFVYRKQAQGILKKSQFNNKIEAPIYGKPLFPPVTFRGSKSIAVKNLH